MPLSTIQEFQCLIDLSRFRSPFKDERPPNKIYVVSGGGQ
jgi:hypothetical protein